MQAYSVVLLEGKRYGDSKNEPNKREAHVLLVLPNEKEIEPRTRPNLNENPHEALIRKHFHEQVGEYFYGQGTVETAYELRKEIGFDAQNPPQKEFMKELKRALSEIGSITLKSAMIFHDYMAKPNERNVHPDQYRTTRIRLEATEGDKIRVVNLWPHEEASEITGFDIAEIVQAQF